MANCWFNTMFVTFFISDKGRKFFRFFRQLMIEGKQENGESIKPKELAQAFFLLNACIEASYNQNLKQESLALALDTNNIIMRISDIFKNKSKSLKHYDWLIYDKAGGNPLRFYQGIIEYLGNKSIKLLEIYNEDIPDINNIIDSNIPDIIILNIDDFESNLIKDKQLTLKVHGYKYVLDSVIIRDTMKNHFCSVITCNGIEYGFDGASLSRMSKFSWKNLLNKNNNWEFEGSLQYDNSPITWNFMNGYQYLFYYRAN